MKKRCLLASLIMMIVGGVKSNAQGDFKITNGYTPPAKGNNILINQGIKGISMTFGRWAKGNNPVSNVNSEKFDYYQNGNTANAKATTNKADGWTTSTQYTYLYHSNATNSNLYTQNTAPDGYSYFVSAQNDAYDECPTDETGGYFDLGGWEGSIPSHTTFDIPCRGGYVCFEPTQNGNLTVYMLQNGCIDFYEKNNKNGKNNPLILGSTTQRHEQYAPNGQISWRPIFITDETGAEIEVTSTEARTTFKESFNEILDYIQGWHWEWNGSQWVQKSSGTAKGNKDGGTNLIWRSSPHINLQYKNWITNGQYVESESGRWSKGSDNDVENPWKDRGEVSSVLRIPANLGGGYLVLMKGYVKYTFPVKAGKSYFIFSNYAKIGLCGFSFSVDAVVQPSAKLTINSDDENLSFTEGQQFQAVTLKGRSFEAGKWTSLCLPFSYSTKQMRALFGADVETVHFNHIGDDRHVAYFDRHVYDQLYVAGVPVFIKPSKTVTNPVFNNVTIDAPQPKNVYPEQYGYTFMGVYGSEEMGEYGYFINDKLYWLKENNMQSGSMRAYFKATSDNSAAAAKPLSSILFTNAFEDGDSETTDIADVLSAGTAGTTGGCFDIYSISGIRVRRQATSTEGLPKGIYVVNGKKVTVK